MTLIPTLRSTLNQRSEINKLHSQLAEKRETVAALKQEQKQWTDPAYVEQQARDRLKFVRVGETSYTVIEPPPALAEGRTSKIAAPSQAAANSPWYAQLWQSMVIADLPSKAAVKSSAVTPARTSVKTPAETTPSATSSATSSAR